MLGVNLWAQANKFTDYLNYIGNTAFVPSDADSFITVDDEQLAVKESEE